jgi:putative peptidoglycan binding protein
MWESQARHARGRAEGPRRRIPSLLVAATGALLVVWLGIGAGLAVGRTHNAPGSGGGGLGATSSTVSTRAAGPTGNSGTTGNTGTTGTTGTTPTTTTVGTVTTTPVTSPYTTPLPPPPNVSPGAASAVFRLRGMWIWELGSSDDGNVPDIIAASQTYGIKLLLIKSSDGTGMWSQFNSTLVSELHAAHLKVCAWQYVYGQHPILEAEAGARAVADGADCLVIDAETEYQGRYVQAQRYMKELRKLLGRNFPIALAGFPYIDYHPAFPYSVFLGPGGVQYNMPQMYWKTIGVTVDSVYQHTYEFNELYQRPISPLGQVYDSPSIEQIHRFRSMSRYYGSTGISWWDWQNATAAEWKALAQPVGPIPGFVAQTTVATLGKGALGDVVVWAQEHLVAAGEKIAIDGDFGPKTLAAVEQFQTLKGLPVTGLIDPETWAALLRYKPVTVTWSIKKNRLTAVVARAGEPIVEPLPKSASAPERRNELAGAPGAGGVSGR